MANNTIEIFGMRLRIVKDKTYTCADCAIRSLCDSCMNENIMPCKDARGNTKRHFELA